MNKAVLTLSAILAAAGCAKPAQPPPPASHVPAPTASAPPAATGATGHATAPALSPVAGAELRPVDDAGDDASFLAFRTRLLSIVRQKDRAALLAAVAPGIRTGFGPDGGRAAFEKQWRLASPDSPLWGELEAILSLGGSFQPTPDGRRFVAPYVYSAWPEDVDAFEHLAGICSGAVVRAEPSAGAPATATLDHRIVAIGAEDPVRKGERDPQWRQIDLGGGRAGWVEASCVRSPVGWRAAFEKRDGQWQMVFLVAGD